MIFGIILLILGLAVFIAAGVKLDDAPGVERNTVIVMGFATLLMVVGGILLYKDVFGM